MWLFVRERGPFAALILLAPLQKQRRVTPCVTSFIVFI